MKKSNKIIAVIVAVVLVASVFVIGTLADTNSATVSVSVNKNEIATGETATVTVAVTTNFPVATMSIPVFYDKTMVSVSDATATATGYDVASTTTDATAIDTDELYDNTGVDSSKYGFVLATYIAGAGDTVASTINTTVLTFTIKALTGVSGEALVNCVSTSAKTEENVAGMLYFGATTSGTTITSIPENVESIDLTGATATVNLVEASGGETALVATDGKDTVIDTTNNYIYGITPGDDIADYITVENGSYDLVANSAGYTNGTGATVNVKNSSGTVVEAYTVVIFGDVNGDASITAADYSAIKNYTLGVAFETDTALVAADCVDATSVLSTNITASDYSAVKNSTMGVTLTTNPYA